MTICLQSPKPTRKSPSTAFSSSTRSCPNTPTSSSTRITPTSSSFSFSSPSKSWTATSPSPRPRQPSSGYVFPPLLPLPILFPADPHTTYYLYLPFATPPQKQTDFITLKPPSSPLQQAIATALTHLGPLLARALVRNMAGHAARSELDKLCEPLKKLVTTRVEAQAWLLAAAAAGTAGGVVEDGDGDGGGEGGSGGGGGGGGRDKVRVGAEERAAWVRRVVA